MQLFRPGRGRSLTYAALALAAAGITFGASVASEKLRDLDRAQRRADELRDRAIEQDHAVRALESRLEELESEQLKERQRNLDEERRLLSEIERLRAQEVAHTAQQVADVEARVQLLREFAERTQLEANARRIDAQLIRKELVEPTVRVNAKSEVGSGSVVYSKKRSGKLRTLILTAWHIVKDNVLEAPSSSIEVDVYDPQGKPREAKGKLVAKHEALDLALLELDDEKTPAVTARLARPADLARAQVFTRVYAIGCPLGYAPLPTSG
ncbi:MAG TPA: trypsin-like peptidase domain-containing protein, partial [Planctomycetota bacterium]|nr:trypsin-like peptidase domain-containing protein [Planctomycetota bacterium]